MKNRTKIVLTIVTGTLIGLLASGNAPLGQLLWPPHEGGPQPQGAQLPLLLAASVIDAVLFGVGIAFLAWGFALFRNAPASPRLARAAHLAIVWMLVSWVPHDNLHVHYGDTSMWALVGLIWGFHVTLGLAGAVLVAFSLRVAGGERLRTASAPGAADGAVAAGR